jgi:uncharacterized protein
MEYKSIKGYNGWAQVGFLVALLGLGILLVGAIQFIITASIAPKGFNLSDAKGLLKLLSQPENVTIARVMQVGSTLALFFIPALMWNFICNGKSLFWLGFNKHFTFKQIAVAFLIMLAASLGAQFFAIISKSIMSYLPFFDAKAKLMEDDYNQQIAALSNLKSTSEYVVALFIMAFFPALFEEVFFRGLLQRFFERWWGKPLIAIVASSIIFSLIHASIYLFLSRVCLGMALGVIFYYTRNIWVNVIAHFINNALALTALYIQSKTTGKVVPQAAEPDAHWLLCIAGMAAAIGLALYLQKQSMQQVQQITTEENYLLEQTIYKPNNLA